MEVVPMTTLEAIRPMDNLETPINVGDVSTAGGASQLFNDFGDRVISGLRRLKNPDLDEDRLMRKMSALTNPLGVIVDGMEFNDSALPIKDEDVETLRNLENTLQDASQLSPWQLYELLVKQALHRKFRQTHGVDPKDPNFLKGEGAIHTIPAGIVKKWIHEHPANLATQVRMPDLLAGLTAHFHKEIQEARLAKQLGENAMAG
jgi:hypothetical protein